MRTLIHNGDIHDGTVSWNLKTKENIDIAFGVYFYVVQSDYGNKKGKIAIIKWWLKYWLYYVQLYKKHFSCDVSLEEINKNYGDFRGTGALKIVNNSWKITQYNLLLPIPNDLLKKYSKEIKEYYKKN